MYFFSVPVLSLKKNHVKDNRKCVKDYKRRLIRKYELYFCVKWNSAGAHTRTHTTPWYYLTTNTYWQCPCTQWTASTSRLITLDTGTNCSNFVKARCPLFSALQRTCKTWPDRVACRVHTRGTAKRNIADVSPVVPELQEIVIVIIDIVAAMCSCNHFGCLHVCL